MAARELRAQRDEGRGGHVSSDLGGTAGPPVARDDLIRLLHEAALPADTPPKIGVEVEWLPVASASGRAHPYLGERGIETLYRRLQEHGFQDPQGAAHPTHLVRGRESVNIEPGGQVEFGTSPLATLGEVAAELDAFAACAGGIARELGFRLIGYGTQPLSAAHDIPQVPKRRYDIMVDHFSRHGGPRYLDMMRQTASIQVNLDYTSERDAGRKLRAAMLMSPVLQALYAHSPVYGGACANRHSERAEIWRHTDEARSGALRSPLEGPWSFERLVDEVLDIPGLVVRADDGGLASAGGRTFREMLAEGVGGRQADRSDWDLHLSSIFTDARLKRRVVECRAPDAPPPEALMSIPALYAGVLYHDDALDEALERLAPLADRYDEGVAEAARAGLDAGLDTLRFRELAAALVALAERGLAARGLGEERFLEPLHGRLVEGRSFAEQALDAFRRGGLGELIEATAI
jgi:glutamate--cysteine ligase